MFKNKIFNGIILVVFISIMIIGGVFVGHNTLSKVYFNQLFPYEEFEYSYDNKYSYLVFSSPKKTVSRIAMYSDKFLEFLDISFTSRKDGTARKILWGIHSYDLFIDHVEQGAVCYNYVDGKWIGVMRLDISATKEELDKGNKDVYYFIGEKRVEEKESVNFVPIYGQINKKNIPKYFLEIYDKQLLQYESSRTIIE